jgi:hypothetical protein
VGRSLGPRAVKYRSASRAGKIEILDSICAVTGLNRDYVRRVSRAALKPRLMRARAPRAAKYDATVITALEKCWAVLNAPAGKRLAPALGELVVVLRGHGELGYRRCERGAAELDVSGEDRAAARPGQVEAGAARQVPYEAGIAV